jgi:hypothetical protein
LKAEDLEERARGEEWWRHPSPPYIGVTLPPYPTATGIWPHLAGQATVGGVPTVVPHGGRNAAINAYFSNFFDLSIYFSKIKEFFLKNSGLQT